MPTLILTLGTHPFLTETLSFLPLFPSSTSIHLFKRMTGQNFPEFSPLTSPEIPI